MKKKTKSQTIENLNRFLLIEGISWERLPKRDLDKLFKAFQKLRRDVEEVFQLLDEHPIIQDPEEAWKRMNQYVI